MAKRNEAHNAAVRKAIFDLVGYIEQDDANDALFLCQSLSYKIMLMNRQYATPFPITPNTIDQAMPYGVYSSLYEQYNGVTPTAITAMMTEGTPVYRVAILIRGKKHRDKKALKRASTKVLRAFKQAIRDGRYGDIDERRHFYEEMVLFHMAFRSGFGQSCVSIGAKRFEKIPKDLTFERQTKDGENSKKLNVHSMYNLDEDGNKYRLDRNLGLNRFELENLHLMILPYIFYQK